jgi:hypothetical protein
MKYVLFWLAKYGFSLSVWYGIDDRLAAYFSVPALGEVPLFLVLGVILFISSSSEQFAVMKVYEGPSS